MIQITKRMEFCGAHFYANAAWTEAENRRVFGKSCNLHGHNYILEVTVTGEMSPDTGMVMNLKTLKTLITEAVIDEFDHKHLNKDVTYFKERLPTPEHLAVVIWELLEPRLETSQGVRLHRIRLHEDGSVFVDYYGERSADV